MGNLATSVNLVLGALTIAAFLLSAALLVGLFSRKARQSALGGAFAEWSSFVAFVAALFATAGSLVYSEALGYEPCKLCWIQRIFMYPQTIVLGMALWTNDMRARSYGLALSVVGGLVALYHYVSQLGWNPLGLECAAVGYSASCAKTFVLQYGFITIPVMAFAAFLLIVTSFLFSMKREKDALGAEQAN